MCTATATQEKEEAEMKVRAPGVKLVSLYDLDPLEVQRFFPEFAAPARRCRYGDCRHREEPDCGVKDAVGAGEISRRRYESYVRIVERPRAES